MKFKMGDLTIDSEQEPWRSEGIRVGFYSAPGTRKSYTLAACVIEPFLQEGGAVVIFQPRSEWHTLRQQFESVIVVGGPFQDVPLAANHARVYAETIVSQGVSMVFDFSETEDRDLVKFAAELLARIYTLQNVVRRPLLLLFEELAEYAPLRTTGKMVEPWVYDRIKSRILKIATQGRPLGFNIAFTSQRPAQLDFTIRMMANASFYGKFHPKDLNDVRSVLKSYDVSVKAEQCVGMPHGSWLAITAQEAKIVRIDAKRVTPHGADTPKLEYEAPKTEQTKHTLQELTAFVTDALRRERQEESEVEQLKKQLTDVKRELNNKTIEFNRLQQTAETLGKIKIESPQVEGVSKDVLLQVQNERNEAYRALQDIDLIIKRVGIEVNSSTITSTKNIEETSRTKVLGKDSREKIYETWSPKLSRCAKNLFKHLLDNPQLHLTRSELAVRTGYTARSGCFASALSLLKRHRLINSDSKHIWID